MEDQFRVSWCTIRRWYEVQKWEEERHLTANTYRALCEHIRFLSNPDTTTDVKLQSNLDLATETMGFYLAHLKYAMVTKDKSKLIELPMGIADVLQKCITATEKAVTAKSKLENGGVDKKEVKHLHVHTDPAKLDDLVKAALAAKSQGYKVSVNDLAKATAELQRKEKK